MPYIIGPVDIDTTGIPFKINLPISPSVDPLLYDRIVINNHSPFLLEARNAENRAWIHPFMGDIMPYSPDTDFDIDIAPTLVGTIAGNPHHFCAEFYAVGEEIQGRSYPAMMAQFGSTLVDSPVLLATDSAHLVPFTGSMIDVTAFQSFQLLTQYEAANAGPPANTAILVVSWFDAAGINEIWRQTYEINSVNSTDCGPTRIVDAMHGSKMQLSFSAGNGAASNASFILFGSNRIIDNPKIAELGGVDSRGEGSDRILAITSTLSVGAGATVQRNVRIGSGTAVWMFGGGATSSSYDVLLYPPSQGSGIRVYSANYTGTPQIAQTLALPRRALTLFIKNNDAVNAKNVFYSLVVAGEG